MNAPTHPLLEKRKIKLYKYMLTGERGRAGECDAKK
jgi:hypothetical protein